MALGDLLFNSAYLSDSIRNQEQGLVQRIHGENTDYIITVNEDSYIQHMVDLFEISPLNIRQDAISVSPPFEKEVTIDDWGRTLNLRKTFLLFSIPFDGDKELFKLRPSQFDLNPPRETIAPNEIKITLEQQGDIDRLKAELNQRIHRIQQYISWQAEEIADWNNQLEDKIKMIFSARKSKLLADNNIVSKLGFPLKKIPGASSVLSYSAPLRKKVASPRPSPAAAAEAHPFLEETNFQEILKTLRDMELVMERSPSAFKDLDEEAIRTHFLLALNGKFEGAATGETFNFQGKTDILLRQENRNIFIAECKFWSGPKGFTETIDQLLNYLTWRDTKSAILVFVRDTAISTVLSKIPLLLKEHPNFISETICQHNSEFRAQLRSARDQAVALHLVVQVFHVPSPETQK